MKDQSIAPQSTLSSNLRIEPSQLYVANLENMLLFYHDLVGLDVLTKGKDRIVFGHDQTDILELIRKPELAYAPPTAAGLFHNAILFGSRGDLSRAAGTVIANVPQLFTGTGDHVVSEAFYFNDPEGNGVELYYDRPAEGWVWENGSVKMDTLYIDPSAYINSHASEHGDPGKKLGHVHLRVGDLAAAKNFYVDVVGFSITAQFPGALFISIAGYHHHIGLNTWMSSGAGPRLPALGLSDVAITLEAENDVAALAGRLEDNGREFTFVRGKVTVSDPWNNKLTFTTGK